MKFDKAILILFVIGVVLRVLLAFFTFHPDSRTSSFTSAMALREGTLSFYDFSRELGENDPRKREYAEKIIDIDDQPLQYLLTLPLFAIVRPLVNPAIEIDFHLDPPQTFGDINLFAYLFYLKFPFLVFDILTAFLLTKFFTTTKQKRIVFGLWIFNPITLWATAMVGQFDILSTFFMVLSLYFLSRRRNLLSASALGFGIALKTFPILLLPFLILSQKRLKEKAVVSILALAPFVAFSSLYVNSAGYRQHALFAPQLDKLLYAKIPLSGAESIFIIPVLIVILIFIFNSLKEKSWEVVGRFWLAILLIALSFTHFHQQWFLWATPLIALFFNQMKNTFKLPIVGLLIAWIIMLFVFDASLQMRIFSPLFPNLKDAVGLGEVLPISSLGFIKSFAATLFAAAGLYISFRIIKND